PVVSPNDTVSAPSATARPAAHSTRSTGTSPSYGQPHAVDTITWQVAPCWCASSMTTAISSSDCSVLRFTFLRLCVSEADTTTSTSVNPAATPRRVLHLQRGPEADPGPLAKGCLRGPYRDRRAGRHPAGQLDRRRARRARRHDPVREPDPRGLPGVHLAAGQDQVGGPARAKP